jgi:hypothetical protein
VPDLERRDERAPEDVEREQRAPLRPDPENTIRTCAVCGTPLAERKCKLYCPRPGCGYFLSCADFY